MKWNPIVDFGWVEGDEISVQVSDVNGSIDGIFRILHIAPDGTLTLEPVSRVPVLAV